MNPFLLKGKQYLMPAIQKWKHGKPFVGLPTGTAQHTPRHQVDINEQNLRLK